MTSRRKFKKSLLYVSMLGVVPFFRFRMNENRLRSGPSFEPGYLKLYKNGQLKKRGQQLWNMMEKCELCPRMCGANSLKGEKGFCSSDSQLMVSSFHPHFGEEQPLVGNGGSGTIFMSNCSLRCVFCINWEISQEGDGVNRSIQQFADMMLTLQKMGCHNINVVTPTTTLPMFCWPSIRLHPEGSTCHWFTTLVAGSGSKFSGCSTAWRISTCPTSSIPTGQWQANTLRKPGRTLTLSKRRCWKCTVRWGWPSLRPMA